MKKPASDQKQAEESGRRSRMLEPDVREYFPDSQAVNRALDSKQAPTSQKSKA